ncbi:MAG: DUF1016 family protein [Cardiobacteriaceae bacterium]|nr:DUF1016 family protein [Cardiobacteriaceae bacterium]
MKNTELDIFNQIQITDNYISDIVTLFEQAKAFVNKQINHAMIYSYWLTGKRIMLQEQQGNSRAEYGKEIIQTLSQELTNKFGKGYSVQSLYNFKMFFERFPDDKNFSTAWRNLSWSHYKLIMRLSSKEARDWYCNESANQNWSVRTLDRNISTQYYERLLQSANKEIVIAEMQEKTAIHQNNKLDFIKNPYVFEFLGLPTNGAYLETEFEQAIINSLQHFLLEMGKGFAFVERQKLIRTETDNFYIDLVFYNFLLKCFVLVDLKVHKITHKDVGQMDMYVRMFDDIVKKSDDNPTIGILLCTDTDRTIAKYSVLNESKQIFASKYLTVLPSEEELSEEIQRQRDIFKEIHSDKE